VARISTGCATTGGGVKSALGGDWRCFAIPPPDKEALLRLIIRILVSAVGLAVAAALVDGISVGPGTDAERALTLLGVAVIFGLVNGIVGPILRFLTCPLVILTLGLFLLVVNALLLLLTEWIAEQFDLAFQVDGFWAAVLGALIISVVSFLINVVLPDKYET
jgi:putative membrane protein